jgi:hypothetical protein
MVILGQAMQMLLSQAYLHTKTKTKPQVKRDKIPLLWKACCVTVAISPYILGASAAEDNASIMCT